MDNKSNIDKFLDFFWTFKLNNKLDNLTLHIEHPQKGTTDFIDHLKEVSCKISFDYQKFNELLDIYINTSNKNDLQKLKELVRSHYNNAEKEIIKIPNDLNKAYSALRGLIGVEDFDSNFQVYDAMVLLKDEISSDLIEEIVSEWKQEYENYISTYGEHHLNSKIFWSSYDGMEFIDNISMYRFKETFNIKEFNSTFKEIRKKIEKQIWEFSTPQDMGSEPFNFWLIDRIHHFLDNHGGLNLFLEDIVKEQTTEGYWENKKITKLTLDENNQDIKHSEYLASISGTALISLNLFKHAKYVDLRDNGIKGVKWLLEQQNPDGSWSEDIFLISDGKLEINNKKSIFATIWALEAIIRGKIPNTKTQIDLAFEWLMKKQNKFGMWENDGVNPFFGYSNSPLVTVLVLELEKLLKFPEKQINSELTNDNSEIIPTSNYEFDIAVSFAGEDRDIVEKYVSILKSESISVFYDKDMKSNLWGKNLVDGLYEIYTSKARYCVMFISKHYLEKIWTNHERQAAQERALKEKSEYILPIKLDDTTIPGMPNTIGYLDLRELTIEEIASETIKKLQNETENVKVNGVIDKVNENTISDNITLKISNEPNLELNTIIEDNNFTERVLGKNTTFDIDYKIQGYNHLDSMILKNIGDLMIEKEDFNYIISGEDLLKRTDNFTLSEDQIRESLTVLDNNYLIKLTITSGSVAHYPIQLTSTGFLTYAENFIENFSEIELKIVSSICKDELRLDMDIAAKNEIPIAIVDFLLNEYIESNYIEFGGHMGGPQMIGDITIIGKRYFKNLLSLI